MLIIPITSIFFIIITFQIKESLPLLLMLLSIGGGTSGTVFLMEDDVRYPATPGAEVR